MSSSQVQDSQSNSGYLEDFKEALERFDSPALLRLWEEYTSSDEVDPEDFRGILIAVKESELCDYIGRHIERGLPLWENVKGTPQGDEILRLMIDLQMTGSLQLRELAASHLDEKFGADPEHAHKMRIVGLRSPGEEFKGSISHYILINHMKKGNYVFHTGGWGAGEVIDLSMIREEANFEFDYLAGNKHLGFKACFAHLIPIPTTHFLARRFGAPDELEAFARKSPVETIRMLLSDLGPKTAAEIRDELSELVIPEGEWNRWWQGARNRIKKDTRIESPSDLKKPFRLMTKEVSHEERLQKALEKKPDAETLIQMVCGFLKDFPETLKNSDFKDSLSNKLTEMLSFPEISPALQLQIHFFLQDLNDEKEYSPIKELLVDAASPLELIGEIVTQSLKKRALMELRESRENWHELFLELLLTPIQTSLRDYIFTELLGSSYEPQLRVKLSEMAADPTVCPEACLWYFQKISNDSTLPFADSEGLSTFFEAFLILLSDLEQREGRRDLVKKMQAILLAGRFSIVRKIMKQSTLKDTKEFLLLVTKCHSLSDHDIKIFYSLAEVAHPELANTKKEAVEEEVIWTTQEGYNKLQKRIEQIGTVETVDNAKEIEVARSHGDLRENAEFKAALERRDRLQSEIKFLSSQLTLCRVLNKDDIHTDKVGVGTTIECSLEDGSKATYTFLGPWDADPDNNILSFQSKLSQSVSGLTAGETFEIQGKKHTIEAIRSAI